MKTVRVTYTVKQMFVGKGTRLFLNRRPEQELKLINAKHYDWWLNSDTKKVTVLEAGSVLEKSKNI